MPGPKRQWSSDIPVSDDGLKNLISAQFPDLSPLDIRPLGEGWDNAVVTVGPDLVFRFPRREIAVECLAAELDVLPWLAPLLPLPVPVPMFVGKPSTEFPWPFYGHRLLEGRAAFLRRLDGAGRARVGLEMANFLRRLHSLPPETARAHGAPPDRIGRLDLDMRVARLRTRLADLAALGLIADPADCAQVVHDLPPMPSERVLVHGDLNFRNYLLDDRGALSAVVDWGDVHLGHPAEDISFAYSFLPPEARADFADAYGGIDPASWRLARFYALYTTLVILEYAHDTEQHVLDAACVEALGRILSD